MPHPLRFLRENSLSLSMLALFVASLLGAWCSGHAAAAAQRTEHGRLERSCSDYLRSGHFLDGVFVNWQAAILQLAVLIVFGRRLRQRGAAHSRKSDRPKPEARRRPWLARHSLSLAFFSAFALAFAGHLLCGTAAQNELAAMHHEPARTVLQYAASSQCWWLVLQAWQAEFFTIGFYIVLSIWLREEESPESKPVGSSDDSTGETNE